MKKIITTLFIFCTFLTIAQAQRYNIKGTVADSTKSPLQSATVLLMSLKDSSLVSFARSQEKGNFELKNVLMGKYFLKITFVGYQNYTQLLPTVEGLEVLDLGIIKLLPISKELQEVQIKADRSPISIKGDTIEYNAGSFKTRPNAVVEDLLKKLPGVEVERDGTVKAQGQVVQKITVDGKTFFGNDPKIATKNLPADAVDKVQVFDRKSDQSQFTGIDDGASQKSINLSLKEDRKKGIFGKVEGGFGGENSRYKANTNLNRFDKGNQLSLIGTANNVNENGFSINDYLNFSGALSQMMSGGGGRLNLSFGSEDEIPFNTGQRQNGYLTSWGLGINGNKNLTKKAELNSSYFYNHLDTDMERNIERQNFLAGRNFTSKSIATSNSQNDSHRLSLTLDQKIDSANSIKFTSNIGLIHVNSSSKSESSTLGESNLLQNDSRRNNATNGSTNSLNGSFLFRHKFDKKGRTFSANSIFGLNLDQRNGNLSAVNGFYNANGLLSKRDSINQTNRQTNDRNNFGTTLSYTEPLGKRKYLEINYIFRKNNGDVNREVYDLRGDLRKLNDNLSNKFDTKFTINRPGFNVKFNQKKGNVSLGLAYQRSDLSGNILTKNISIDRTFENFLPNIKYNRKMNGGNNLSINYDTDIQEPSINQLAPIIDNTDPLNIMLGNPELRPEYNHRINANYMSFNQFNFANLFVNLSLVYTENKISNAQSIDNFSARTYKPINFGANTNLNSSINYGRRLGRIKSNINLGTGLGLVMGQSLINDVTNETTQSNIRGNIRFDFNPSDKISLSVDAQWRATNTSYSINTNQNQRFINKTYNLDLTYTPTKKLSFSSAFDYFIYQNQNRPTQSFPIWNASVSTFVTKNDRGEFKFTVTDLLNRNVGINLTADANYSQTERIRSLGRYFLMSFTYAIRGSLKNQGGISIKTR